MDRLRLNIIIIAALLLLTATAAAVHAQEHVVAFPAATLSEALDRGELEAGEQELSRLRASYGADPTLHLFEGLFARKAGDLERAASHFRRGLALDEDRRDLRLELATTLSWSGQHAEAQALYDDAARRDPDDWAALLGAARMRAWRGEHDDARTRYEALIARPDAEIPARLGLAALERSALDDDAARAQLQHVLTLDPNNAAAQSALSALDDSLNQGRIHVGFAMFHNDTPTWGGTLMWQHQFDSRHQLTLDANTRSRIDGAIEQSVALSYGVRILPELALQTGYRLRFVDAQDMRSHLLLASSWRVHDTVTLLAAIEPGIQHDTLQPSVLVRGGASTRLAERIALTLLVFHSQDGSVGASTSFSARTDATLLSVLHLNASASVGLQHRDDSPFYNIGAGASVDITDALSLRANYSFFSAAFQQHHAQLGLEWRY